MTLKPLPATSTTHREHNWPQGWWLLTAPLTCCHSEKRRHKPNVGDPVYLTGSPGEVYCAKHAPVAMPVEETQP
jgi:hypothetical protein